MKNRVKNTKTVFVQLIYTTLIWFILKVISNWKSSLSFLWHVHRILYMENVTFQAFFCNFYIFVCLKVEIGNYTYLLCRRIFKYKLLSRDISFIHRNYIFVLVCLKVEVGNYTYLLCRQIFKYKLLSKNW